jgi:CRP/FNR family cyclic AMP-dependent transcriptional regulator
MCGECVTKFPVPTQIELAPLKPRVGEQLELANNPRRTAFGITRATSDGRDVGICFHLANIGRSVRYRAGRSIFAQGDPANSLFLLIEGRVWIVVSSSTGRESSLSIPYPGMFFGHDCLAKELRRSTARALTNCVVIRIEREQMVAALRDQQSVREMFINFLLWLQGRYEDAIVDHSVNRSELRLVRTLVELAYAGRSPRNVRQVSGVPQEILAELVGTTRARVNYFMSRLRQRGVIDYRRNSIWVHPSLVDLLNES